MLWLKFLDFESDDHVAVKMQVIAQKVQKKLAAFHFNTNLTADEGNGHAKLEQEISQMIRQPALQIAFLSFRCQ